MDAGTPLPAKGFVAVLEQNQLLLVSPEEYFRIHPDEAGSHEPYIQVMTHEIIHRLHVAVLEGDEDAMGPVWFYESFAVIGAEQYPEGIASLTEVCRIAKEEQRGSYIGYGRMMRYLLRNTSLVHLVELAQTRSLTAYISGLCASSSRL